jgi:hypothetical protein
MDDIMQRRDRKLLYLLDARRRYDAFKGGDPTLSSLMRRATGCAPKGEGGKRKGGRVRVGGRCSLGRPCLVG